MRIIKRQFLRESAQRYPKAAKYLAKWETTVKQAIWRNLSDVRKTYPATDAVKVASHRQVLVFNVCGNDYRLIVAAHFNSRMIYTLRFLTHAEYSKDRWKDEL